MSETLKSTMRKAAVVAMVALGLLAGQAEAATLYISEFASGVSQGGTTTAQTAPQIAVADQTVALSGSSALSSAFNSKTNAVTLMCDEGCSIKFGTTNAVSATTSNYLLQQGVYYRYGAAPGWFVAAIANAAGNTATGSGGATNATIVGPLGQQTSAGSVSVALSSDGGQATAANQEVTAAGASAASAQGVQGVTGGVALPVGGSSAQATTASESPIRLGGTYISPIATQTSTSGQKTSLITDGVGNLRVQIIGATTGATDAVNNATMVGIVGEGATTGVQPLLDAPYAFSGTTWDRQFTCPLSAPINVTAASTTQLVALSGSTAIRVCSFVITESLAGTAAFVYGTGTNCATGQTAITGAMALSTGGSLYPASGNGSLFRTAAANALCLTAVTGNITGEVTYAQY